MSKRRTRRRRSHKAGLPPGSLIHIGEEKVDTAEVTLIVYDEQNQRERVVLRAEDCHPEKIGDGGVKWINVNGLHDVDVLEKLGRAYGLHHLTVEDILNTDQRPKLEVFDGYLFLVIKMLAPGKGPGTIQSEQISLVLGHDFLLSFQEREGDVFEPVRRRIRETKGKIRKQGVDYLAYALLDTTVDHYFVVLEEVEEKLESLEADLFEGSDENMLRSIQTMRKGLIHFRRSVWPLREVIKALQRDDLELIKETTRAYLRDVNDHTIHVIDAIESFRESIDGIFELYLSSLSNRMNNIMKVLALIATIFIPLTFITGVYGMNFKHMPELEWPWSYPAVMGFMLGLGCLMVHYFKKRKWL